MNAITMSETAAETTEAPEASAIEIEAANGVAHLLPDTKQVPLSKLIPSPANVRRVNAAVNISELADSIEAHGLIQNLTVRKAKRGNKYEVVAGARRFAALLLLAKEGRIDAGTLITCNLRNGADNDTEISLAENTQREAMHVVDEVLAYRQLIEDGMAPENIAARFGQSVVTVRQRLKLASLSPKILDVLREDQISMDQAKALAITDDHAAQETVWFEGPSWNRAPHSLRAALTSDHMRSTDKLALFVGMEAYEAEGGAILRDLFADANTTFLTNRPLLTKLATDKLEQEADLLRVKGWKWVETGLDASGIYNLGYGRIYPIDRIPTDDEQAELARLGEQFDEIMARIEDYAEGDPAIEADEATLRQIEQRIEAIQTAGKAYDTDEKALAGCIVTISHSGGLQVEMGLVRPDDLAALRRLRQPEQQDDTGNDVCPSDDDAEEQPAAYSAALIEELTAIRTAAMRVEMVNRPQVALAAVLYPLVMQVFHEGPRYLRPASSVEISGDLKDLTPAIKEPEACTALTNWNDIRDKWSYDIPGKADDLWEWLLEQTLDRLSDLLAVVVAANINAVEAKHDHVRDRLAHADKLAAAVHLDMRRHWSAKAPFLSRLSKAQIIEVMTEAECNKSAIKSAGKACKAEAVALAEEALKTKSWLPWMLQSQSCEE